MRRQGVYDSYIRTERERDKRRIAWQKQQEREQEHERRKREKIEEYERKRAEQLGLKYKRRSSSRNYSKRENSKSSNFEQLFKSSSRFATYKHVSILEKHHSSKDNKSNFNEPEDEQIIHSDELRDVKVTIYRNTSEHTTETIAFRLNATNANKILLTRREGEGAKPIFDREEIKTSEEIPNEAEEHRTIELTRTLTTDKKNDSEQSSTTRKFPRSPSFSPKRRRSTSSSFRRRRSISSNLRRRRSGSSSSRWRRSESPSSRRRRSPSPGKRTSSRSGALESRRHSDTRKSMSRETRRRTSSEDYKSKSNVHCTKEYRESRERRKGRSHDRRERRDSSRERRLSPTYFERMPFPGHYWGYVPRPMLTGPPMPPIGRPMMFGPRMVPPIMGPMIRGRFPAPMYPPHDSQCNKMAAIPQGAFAAIQVRKNFKRLSNTKYGEEDEDKTKGEKNYEFNSQVLQEEIQLHRVPMLVEGKLDFVMDDMRGKSYGKVHLELLRL
uniref:Transformer-like protein B isoform t1 n=1 Tax=Ceratosolen solmsi TaxID=142686 RepID=A0A0U2V806_9HYME|nr:transformer-like protein B isoform t1 [Ceratosolen solmsi]